MLSCCKQTCLYVPVEKYVPSPGMTVHSLHTVNPDFTYRLILSKHSTHNISQLQLKPEFYKRCANEVKSDYISPVLGINYLFIKRHNSAIEYFRELLFYFL